MGRKRYNACFMYPAQPEDTDTSEAKSKGYFKNCTAMSTFKHLL